MWCRYVCICLYIHKCITPMLLTTPKWVEMAEEWVGAPNHWIVSISALYLPSPSSCWIMLLCVCLWVCNLCVKECVFLRSLCQCVCSSNTGFSPYYPHLPLLFSPHFWWLHTNPPVNFKLNHIYPSCHYFNPSTFPCMQFICSTLTFHFHPPAHPFISPLTNSLHLVSITNPLRSLHFSSLLSRSSFSLPPSPCPLGSPPFIPSSLSFFHTVLCASLALAGLLLGGWEFVCTQVPAEHPLHPGSQPGSASLLLILLLLLLSLPFFPAHSIATIIICPLYMTPHPTSRWTHSPLHRPASWFNIVFPSLSEAHCSWVVLWCPLKLSAWNRGVLRLWEARSLHACLAKPHLCLYFICFAVHDHPNQ